MSLLDFYSKSVQFSQKTSEIFSRIFLHWKVLEFVVIGWFSVFIWEHNYACNVDLHSSTPSDWNNQRNILFCPSWISFTRSDYLPVGNQHGHHMQSNHLFHYSPPIWHCYVKGIALMDFTAFCAEHLTV